MSSAQLRRPLLPRVAPDPPVSDDEQKEGSRPVAGELTKIAQASVALASLGPQLATLAGELETQAEAQAKRAETVAAAMDALAQDLQTSVTELRTSSVQMHDALRTVERIADYTRLLSINASIEAARAGEQGRAFAVVVDEVKRLADNSGQNTKLIEQRVQEIESSVSRVAAVALSDGTFDALAPASDRRTVAAVNYEVRGMADSAGKQLGSAESVHALGDQINALTESLLLGVGRFRFGAHTRAQQAVEQLVPVLLAHMPQRAQVEHAIEPFLRAHPYFELGYVTDARGRQITDNLISAQGKVTHNPAGLGRDWSDRPWFSAALDDERACSTDVYRSTATGDFCFTIAMALRTEAGELIGVFGCDVNFQRLVSG
ncbi:MAG: methyl-accepting chemotaxis protein [Opitutus sp.]